MNDLDGQYGQNLISRVIISVSRGKRAICDRVHLLKLAKACNRCLMRAVFFRFHFQHIQRMFPRFGIEGGVSYCRRFVAMRHFPCGQSPHQLIIMGSLGEDTALDRLRINHTF